MKKFSVRRYTQSYRPACYQWAQTVALLPALCPCCQDVVVDRTHGEAGILVFNSERRVRNVLPEHIVALLRAYVPGDSVEEEVEWVRDLIRLYETATHRVGVAT